MTDLASFGHAVQPPSVPGGPYQLDLHTQSLAFLLLGRTEYPPAPHASQKPPVPTQLFWHTQPDKSRFAPRSELVLEGHRRHDPDSSSSCSIVERVVSGCVRIATGTASVGIQVLGLQAGILSACNADETPQQRKKAKVPARGSHQRRYRKLGRHGAVATCVHPLTPHAQMLSNFSDVW
eukprot:2174469-Rhodomonas_salina.1